MAAMSSEGNHQRALMSAMGTTSDHKREPGVRPHTCTKCGVGFRMEWQLRRHMRMHAGIKPHRCEICGRSFGERDTLTKHVRTHTGEKPYKCPVCERGFAQSGVMKSHLLSKHMTLPQMSSV